MRVEASGTGGAGNGYAGGVAGLPAGALRVQPLREPEPVDDENGLRNFPPAEERVAEWEIQGFSSCFCSSLKLIYSSRRSHLAPYCP
jgi:hypothetical protein